MNSTTKGLVIREQTTGENDRLVTLLTADHGLVRAFVRGGKQLKNRRAAATSLFCYGEFALYRGRDAYTVDSAAPIEVFFGLRQPNILPSLATNWRRRNNRRRNCCACC